MTLSKPERNGVVALVLMIVVLLIVRFSMQYWVEQPVANVQQIALAAAEVKKGNSKAQSQYTEKQALPPGTKINLNTADSLTLISLPGIGKGLSHRILERRRQLGKFTSMEQVLEVYKFKEETKEMLLQSTVVE